MNVFADLHHSALYYSFHLLFVKRFGWELLRPIGMEWFPQWWDIAKPYGNSIDTAKQYLDMRDVVPKDGTPVINNILNEGDTHHEIQDKEFNYIQKALTLEQFRSTKIDFIIASVTDHFLTYRRLRDKYQPQAKLICHIGNWEWNTEKLFKSLEVENLMASVKEFRTGVNTIFYHQEMNVAEYQEPSEKQITSLVHMLPKPEIYNAYKSALPEFQFRAYGSSSPDGWGNVPLEMKKSLWGWHVKPYGDGFGHIWHRWFMQGRPVITNFSDYQDKLGGELFENKITGLNLENGTLEENINLIRTLPAIEMGKRARKRFFEIVDYDAEAIKIKNWFDTV